MAPAVLRTEPGLRHAGILGLGVYRPARVVENADLAERLGLSPEWIEKRSGIRSRRYADDGETLPMMGERACAEALAAAGLDGSQVDCVIAATGTHLLQFPAVAVEVARRIGAQRAGAFDVNAACAGFPYALAVAGSLVRSGEAKHVVVLGVERMTDILDHDDATTAFLFADGAGAAVVGPTPGPGIGPVRWGADDSRREAVGMTGYWVRGLRADPEQPWPVLGMSGWRVFRWAVSELAPTCRAALASAGVTAADLGAFVPHQANQLITEAVAQQLELPPSVAVACDIAESGNTSAASIPLAMQQVLASGAARPGAQALLVGFGSGLVHAAQVVVLPGAERVSSAP